MLAGYLRHVLIVASVLLMVGLTIDLWPQIDLITGNGNGGALRIIWRMLRFSALRTPGLMAPVLPFAVFLGVAWTEIQHTQSGERMFIWNTGRLPLQCLLPALLLGVLIGAVEFGMDAYLGPASMAVQMQERLGRDGMRLDRTRTGDVQWIASPAGLLKTEIGYGPPPVLRNLTFFRLDASGHLAEIDKARTARLVPDTGQWRLEQGSLWLAAPGAATDDAEARTISPEDAAEDHLQPFASRTASLDVDPLWLSAFGMEAQYLPVSVLRRLAAIDEGQLPTGKFRTRLQVLYGEAFMPAAMALLAASLSVLLLPYRVPPRAVVGILLTGYLAHSGTKACVLMGQDGFLSPALAGWLVPAALSCATAAVAMRMLGVRRGRATASSDAVGWAAVAIAGPRAPSAPCQFPSQGRKDRAQSRSE